MSEKVVLRTSYFLHRSGLAPIALLRSSPLGAPAAHVRCGGIMLHRMNDAYMPPYETPDDKVVP
jgi:hypothetical protein